MATTKKGEIIRTETVTVGNVGENEYGDLTFADTAGVDYKVSAKRKQHFEGIIVPDATVQLNYSTYLGNEFIYSATQVKGVQIARPAGADPKPIVLDKTPSPAPSRDNNINACVAIKEIGDCIRAKVEIKPEFTALYWGWIGHALAGILPPAVKQAPTAKLKHPQPVKEEEPPLEEIPF
jgi:hypothetical protein